MSGLVDAPLDVRLVRQVVVELGEASRTLEVTESHDRVGGPSFGTSMKEEGRQQKGRQLLRPSHS